MILIFVEIVRLIKKVVVEKTIHLFRLTNRFEIIHKKLILNAFKSVLHLKTISTTTHNLREQLKRINQHIFLLLIILLQLLIM